MLPCILFFRKKMQLLVHYKFPSKYHSSPKNVWKLLIHWSQQLIWICVKNRNIIPKMFKENSTTDHRCFHHFWTIFTRHMYDFIISNSKVSFSHMTFVNTDNVRADRRSAPQPNTSRNLLKYFTFVCTRNPDAIIYFTQNLKILMFEIKTIAAIYQ